MSERKRRQKLAKCAALLQTEVKEVAQVLRKNLLIFGSEMWYLLAFLETLL